MTDARHAQLDARLVTLVDECGAVCAFVIDSSGEVYGASQLFPHGWREVADAAISLVADEVEARALARGGHLHLVRAEAEPFVAAVSFAGVYLVVLVFDAPFAATFVTRRLHRALPEIEALTVTLPPRDPHRDAAVRRLPRLPG